MDIARIQKLAGIIAESADVTDKIKKDKLTTDNKGEAITNKIVQGKNGDVQVSDEATPEAKPTVPKDVKEKKSIGLKEAFMEALTSRDFMGGKPAFNPAMAAGAQAAAAPNQQSVVAYNQWKKDCLTKDPKCTFTGVQGGTEAANWTGVRKVVVGMWDKATGKGEIYGAM